MADKNVRLWTRKTEKEEKELRALMRKEHRSSMAEMIAHCVAVYIESHK